MNYKLKVIFEPQIKGVTGRRYLEMNVTAESEEQAINFGNQMLKPLLKDGITKSY